MELAISRHSQFEKLTFDWLFFNIFCLDFVYKLLPAFPIPSNIMAFVPVLMGLICILPNMLEVRFLHKGFSIYIGILLLLLGFAVTGNAFLQRTILTPSFLVLNVFCIFLFTRVCIEDTVEHLSYISIAVGLIAGLYTLRFVGETTDEIANQYMAVGYTLSLQAIILFECNKRSKSRTLLVLASIFTALVLIFGNRGALLVIVAYFIITFAFVARRTMSRGKFILVTFSLIFLLTILILFYSDIVNAIYSACTQAGIQSRTIDKLAGNSFSESRGRDLIYGSALKVIRADPLTPKGIGFFTTVHFSDFYINANAHNMFLELVIEFGAVFGCFIFVCILLQAFASVKMRAVIPSSAATSLAFCLLLQAVIQLMFSSTLYASNELWLGLVLLSILKRRVRIND